MGAFHLPCTHLQSIERLIRQLLKPLCCCWFANALPGLHPATACTLYYTLGLPRFTIGWVYTPSHGHIPIGTPPDAVGMERLKIKAFKALARLASMVRAAHPWAPSCTRVSHRPLPMSAGYKLHIRCTIMCTRLNRTSHCGHHHLDASWCNLTGTVDKNESGVCSVDLWGVSVPAARVETLRC